MYAKARKFAGQENWEKGGLSLTRYLINGGNPLHGTVNIAGMKNAAVAIIPATILVNGVCRIENVPQISDVSLWVEILLAMGARVRSVSPTTLEIDCRGVRCEEPPYELMRKMRASYYMVGAMLGRFGRSRAGMPGGCNFGDRPIDQHLKCFAAFGAETQVENGTICAETASGVMAGNIYFDKVSVGATINAMLTAALAPGQSVIENAAKEPHIVDVANFLNSMGAVIRGAGTDVIKVRGVSELHGGTYSIIPDQIEAGTFLAAVAAAGGDIVINNIIPKHLECITAKFEEMGVHIFEGDDFIRVSRAGPLKKTNITTLPYPGFPTDMQPQAAAVLCLAQGTSVLTEGVYENRYRYVEELRRMGADIRVDGRTAVISSVPRLTGAPVKACDLRAGVALVIAALSAEGATEVDGIVHIERGYEDLVRKLSALGADIRRVEMVAQEERAEA